MSRTILYDLPRLTFEALLENIDGEAIFILNARLTGIQHENLPA